MKNLKVKALIIGSVLLVLLAAIYYYVALPAINIHSSGFGSLFYLYWLLQLYLFVLFHAKIQPKKMRLLGINMLKAFALEFKNPKDRVIFRLMMGVVIGAVAIFLIGSLLSSEVINASKYQALLTVETKILKKI